MPQCANIETQCDLGRPACQRCIKYGVECPGYRDQQDLVFRNADPNVAKKPKKKRAKPLSDEDESSPSPDASEIATPSGWWEDNQELSLVVSNFNASASGPDWSNDDACLRLGDPRSLQQHWTSHSIPIITNIYGALSFVQNMFQNYTADGPLLWAAHLFSRTYVTNIRHSTSIHKESDIETKQELGTYMGRTLSAVSKALSVPGGAMRDDVLATIYILSNYEVRW